MKKSRKIAKVAAVSAALALVMLVSASAATWNEMRQNGIVSDVSETNRVGNEVRNGIANGIDRVEDGVERIGEDITGKPGRISYMLQKDLLLPYRTIEDNPHAIEGFYYGRLLEHVDMTVEDCRSRFAAVTREQIAEVVSGVTLDTVYFLKGKEAAE